MEEYDYVLKIIMVGDSGVGKSSIFSRYCESYYNNTSISTIGVDYNVKKLYYNDKKIKLQIWDTAGQERYRTITSSYYRGAHIIMLVFDLTNECSFTRLIYWITEMKKYIEHNNFVLVGNKIDKINNCQVNKKHIDKFISEHNIEYVEVSAKKNINITQAFEKLLPKLIATNPKSVNKKKYRSKILRERENDRDNNNNDFESSRNDCC